MKGSLSAFLRIFCFPFKRRYETTPDAQSHKKMASAFVGLCNQFTRWSQPVDATPSDVDLLSKGGVV
jgi:hypothetical protein